ncbi:hypothetical protein KL935_004581 [Ogataea polymorpha]|uniref:Holocytochrome c-type synthase n=1 Tax=Ogataea polymorpha TaxID=460523 RepID=A0A9P8PW50_9ASCO|nr:hypothetical protein KL908_004060 [Ogataea polymorpha]KAG7898028.1 hypothetical protein KL935_004581 [Ogataea polymorpha]KAG7906194.1 hypothetical protein KL906_004647 [Ogataea polymorpha]KAG7930577.1 hypothetical protein KL934_004650 [Ogataea polymorpha]KAH3678702.1 hypothetical protein OGATHE_000252 [Ogataea polymorpha]
MSQDQPKCPVDHGAREKWLAKAKQIERARNTPSQEPAAPQSFISRLLWAPSVSAPIAPSQSTKPPGHPQTTSHVSETCPVDHEARKTWLTAGKTTFAPEAVEQDRTCSSDDVDSPKPIVVDVDLPEEREVSSIPRTGAQSNWIYPSQKQFFNAMRRKDWNPDAGDMKTIVPIHNMVNERAWAYILMWERGQGGEKCGGVQLTSFKGDSKKITPRARIRNLIFGADLPFDRHDWIIDRCGKRVDYVIDFYSTPPANEGDPAFYLDVRPKLNTLEGCRLRLFKALGL